jgi:hypothetical protein
MGYGLFVCNLILFWVFKVRVYGSIFVKVLQVLEGRGRAAVAYTG